MSILVGTTDVKINNSIATKVAKAEAISEYMGIKNNTDAKWQPTIGKFTGMTVSHGIINENALFACSDSYNTRMHIITYTHGSLSHPQSFYVDLSGEEKIKKCIIYDNEILVLMESGKLYACGFDTDEFTTGSITIYDKAKMSEKNIIDICVMNNELWLLTPASLICVNSFTDTVNTYDYPHQSVDVAMETIVESVGGNDVIVYANTSQLPVFLRFNIKEKKFSVFTSSTPFTIVNAIVLTNDNVSTLYTYSTDAKVRTVTLVDKIGFFDFDDYQGYQWVGKCTYYDGYVYNQYLDLSTGNAKLFLARSINGIIFQIISEEFDYYDERYGMYCQGDGVSVFTSPVIYSIPTVDICGIDYSRYCDEVEIIDAKCTDIDTEENILAFDISDTEFIHKSIIIDLSSIFINIKVLIDGVYKSITSTKLKRIDTNNDKIYIDMPNFDISKYNDTDCFKADFVAKIIH